MSREVHKERKGKKIQTKNRIGMPLMTCKVWSVETEGNLAELGENEKGRKIVASHRRMNKKYIEKHEIR
jgi:hypothetical protein